MPDWLNASGNLNNNDESLEDARTQDSKATIPEVQKPAEPIIQSTRRRVRLL
jgi:hypothetical protein